MNYNSHIALDLLPIQNLHNLHILVITIIKELCIFIVYTWYQNYLGWTQIFNKCLIILVPHDIFFVYMVWLFLIVKSNFSFTR